MSRFVRVEDLSGRVTMVNLDLVETIDDDGTCRYVSGRVAQYRASGVSLAWRGLPVDDMHAIDYDANEPRGAEKRVEVLDNLALDIADYVNEETCANGSHLVSAGQIQERLPGLYPTAFYRMALRRAIDQKLIDRVHVGGYRSRYNFDAGMAADAAAQDQEDGQ
jgi:hypothetical protein